VLSHGKRRHLRDLRGGLLLEPLAMRLVVREAALVRRRHQRRRDHEVGGRAVAQAKLFFTFVPTNQFAPTLRDEVLERFLAESRT